MTVIKVKIRPANKKDLDGVWEIFRRVIEPGDTYVFDPKTPKQDLPKHWFSPPIRTYVASHQDVIVGTYILKPNFVDLGCHIANASYMVHPDFRGQGIGSMLCEHSLAEAKKLGFIGIQFNIVVSTNKEAIHIWKKFGFTVIGTIPGGFNHKRLGYVDTLIMYKEL